MRRYALDESVDALIIGTGAGGAPLMARLARAGLSAVALEAVQWSTPMACHLMCRISTSVTTQPFPVHWRPIRRSRSWHWLCAPPTGFLTRKQGPAVAKKENFLSVIDRCHKNGEAEGDRHGGAGGADGSGLPTSGPGNFMFATGIECSNPTIGHGRIRRALLDECGHYTHWRKDLQLVKSMGLKVLRYGLPYHRTHFGIGKYDWSFADEVMQEMQRLKIMPILDLLHFGVPDWLGNFQNPELLVHFAAYAGAVARRYPWVRFYTPVNEIYVCAKFSAKEGKWNEQLKSGRGFVTALKHLVAANTLACHAIVRQRPDAVIVQSQNAEYVHEIIPEKSAHVALENQLRFLALDLLYANPPDANVMCCLLDNGLTRAEYAWNMRGEPPGHQIMGNDYYGRNETMLLPDGSRVYCEDVLGWYQITKQYYKRYKRR